MPPLPTARNLAEGYRHRLEHLERMIQQEMRQHPRYPESKNLCLVYCDSISDSAIAVAEREMLAP